MTLSEFFSAHRAVAIAFSGGVDSAYLLYAAMQHGAQVGAYYARSAFQPQFELDDAQALAEALHVRLKLVDVDVLCEDKITENSAQRCYYCKHAIFSAIADAAQRDGFSLLLDGTNASDDIRDRPGMRALQELKVRSPLRECALTKAEIRHASRQAGLFTWDKPAYACLATRLATGERITVEKLKATEAAENALYALGFRDFRVRAANGVAKLQLREPQLALLMEHRAAILAALKKYYTAVTLDLEVRE